MSPIAIRNILLFAKASNRWIPLPPPAEEEMDLPLLSYLRRQGFPIASSCGGLGHCEKCRVNGNLLSCQYTLRQLFLSPPPDSCQNDSLIIKVDYL